MNRKVLLLTAALVVAISSGEFFLRIAAGRGWIYIPVFNRAMRRTDRDYLPDGQRIVVRGQVPFRSLRFEKEKPRDTLRIVTLGDSFTWGSRIRDPRLVWPHVLEENLRATGQTVEVVNLAVPALTTEEELAFLEKFGWDFKPDIVVLQYLVNDALPAIPKAAGAKWLRDEVTPLAIRRRWHRVLDDQSYVYSFLNEDWQKLAVRFLDKKNLTYIDLHADGAPTWINTQAALSKMAQECDRRGVRFLMVMFPLINGDDSLDGTFQYAGVHAKVGEFARQQAIPFVDLWPVLAKINLSPKLWRVRVWDSHPSVAYHAVAAEAIADKLISFL